MPLPVSVVPYSGLLLNPSIMYPGPDGEEQHYYYGANAPALAAPETGLIIQFPQPPQGKVHVIDKFNASVISSDTSQNCILVDFISPDQSKLYWEFCLQLGLLIGNPNYSYPTFLADKNWCMALSFQANTGAFPVEYFSFRYRLLNKDGRPG